MADVMMFTGSPLLQQQHLPDASYMSVLDDTACASRDSCGPGGPLSYIFIIPVAGG